MTQIDFYAQAEDKLQTACRLVSKARSMGMRVTVFCPDRELASRLDRLLWTIPATGFIPHCRPGDPQAPLTPVLIDEKGDTQAHDEVLINLHSDRPAGFSRFQRLAEIVGKDEEDRAAARNRYKFYRDRGYSIRTHDLSTTSSR